MASIAVLGENVVDCVANAQGALQPALGGSPLNVALALARQQQQVTYLSPISSDHFGDAFVRLLKQQQVQLPTRRSEKPSSLAVVQIDKQGQPHYSLYRQGIADRDLHFTELCSALPADCRLLHTGSLALDPADQAVVRPFLHWCISQHCLLSIDINVRLAAISDVAAYRLYLQEILPMAHFIKASDEDLAALYPSLSLTSAVTMLRQIAPKALLVITAGAQGATLYQQTRTFSCPAITPGRFVDTVGAGDTFFANFLATLATQDALNSEHAAVNYPDALLQQALLRGAMAASLNIAQAGCVPPNRDELNVALANHAD